MKHSPVDTLLLNEELKKAKETLKNTYDAVVELSHEGIKGSRDFFGFATLRVNQIRTSSFFVEPQSDIGQIGSYAYV